MKLISAKFIGEDGSMGYRKSKEYRLLLWAKNGFTCIDCLDKCHKTKLPKKNWYSTTETFLDNWTEIKAI